MSISLLRVGLHTQSLHHKGKDGQTTSTAGRIKMEMITYLLLGRITPPKLGYPHWSQTIEISILQQFGSAALPCSRRRKLYRCITEDVEKIALLAFGIEHHEMREQPTLKFLGTQLAF